MTAQQLLKQSLNRLTSANIISNKQEVEILFLRSIGGSTTDLITKGDQPVSSAAEQRFERLLQERLTGRPLGYIIGSVNFYNQLFLVNQDVLIPRPETEILIEQTINRLKTKKPSRILEVGTGSGVIAASLKKAFPEAIVIATDISPAALQVARTNAQQLGLAIEFIKSNLLEQIAKIPFDAIIANLPYIPTQEMANISLEVTNFEPHLALDGDDDGLGLIERLLKSAGPFLQPNGLIALEIWHTQGDTIRALAERYLPGCQVDVTKDLAGFDRFVFVTCPARPALS